MSVLDIATHVEVASQPPTNLAPRPSKNRNDSSSDGYQKALSSSLNQSEKRPHGAGDRSSVSHSTHDARLVEADVATATGSESGLLIDSAVPENSSLPGTIEGVLVAGASSTSLVIPQLEPVVSGERLSTGEQSAPSAGEADGSENTGQIQPVVFSQIVSEPPSNFQFSLQSYQPPEETVTEGTAQADQPLPPSNFLHVAERQSGLSVEKPDARALPTIGPVSIDEPPSDSIANQPIILANATPQEQLPVSDGPPNRPKLFGDARPVEPEIIAPGPRPEFSATVESTNAEPEGGARVDLESPAAGIAAAPETPAHTPVTRASRTGVQINDGQVLGPNPSASGRSAAPPQNATDGHLTAAESSASVREVAIANVHVHGESAVRPADGDIAPRASEFVDRLSETIRLSQQQNRPLRLRLHPPELGTLQVEVVSRNGNLSIRLQVENSVAHRAILDSLALLQDALGQNGTVVERIDVQQVANLSDGRASESGREGDADSEDSPAERRQQDTEQRHKRDQRASDDQHPQDSEEIDIEI